jgi:23S rRNA (uracil1939-C5)-methyltransferase
VEAARLTGAIATVEAETAVAGDPIVTDPLSTLTNGRIQTGTLRRHPQSFFQANRFLIASLVVGVLDAVRRTPVVDLYAGVGLFAVSLAAAGVSGITAVEGNHASSRDLQRNAAPFPKDLRVERGSVEAFVQNGAHKGAETMIVDPPRTGMSRAAAEVIARSRISRIVYVSCDAATMARDARRLLDAGYRLTNLHGFDLFPNTPHVESLGVFDL